MRGACIVGPTNKQSFRETPVLDLAEASKTALNLVVVLVVLDAACTGR